MQEAKSYQRKPQTIEAVQLSRANQGLVKRWTKGFDTMPDHHGDSWLQIRDEAGELVSVHFGDWVVLTETGQFETFTDRDFRRTYAPWEPSR